MIVLAIDTSSATGSVALVRDGVPLRETALTSLPGHSESLLFAVATALDAAGLTLEDVDLLAAGVGPGSFTGLRVGLAAMKGLHLAARKPLLGAPSLLALAMNFDRSDRTDLVCAAIDARRGDVFAAAYRVTRTSFVPVVPEQMTRPPELLSTLAALGGTVVCLGDAFRAQKTEVEGRKSEVGEPISDLRPPSSVLVPSRPFMTVPSDPRLHLPSAVNVAAIAAGRFSRGETDSAAALEPRYVRPVDFKKSA